MPAGNDSIPLSQEDLELWEYVTRNDAILPGKAVKKSKTKKAPITAKPEKPEPEKIIPPKIKGKTELPNLSSGDVIGVDASTATKLKRGQMRPDIRLDLHGFTLEEAHLALRHAVFDAYARNKRVMLVITGKGLRSGERKRTIRGEISHWLNEPAVRAKILIFSPANAKDGGDGAFYILLKRKRETKE